MKLGARNIGRQGVKPTGKNKNFIERLILIGRQIGLVKTPLVRATVTIGMRSGCQGLNPIFRSSDKPSVCPTLPWLNLFAYKGLEIFGIN